MANKTLVEVASVVRGIVGLALAAVLALAGCYTAPTADHFAAIVDELRVPAGWQSVETVVHGPDEDEPCDPFFTITCPGAMRSFLVDGDPADAYAQAKEVVTAAGFAITEEFREDCTGASGESACNFFSSRDGDPTARICSP